MSKNTDKCPSHAPAAQTDMFKLPILSDQQLIICNQQFGIFTCYINSEKCIYYQK